VNIWFDLSNSPHINMFRMMIGELQQQHRVIVTCRPLANTIDLLKMYGMEHTAIGTHYGKSTAKKIYGFPIRVMQLREFLRDKNIHVAVSQSSFHSPVVAKSMGIKSIYLNDNEHALGNVPAFAFADRIMVPEFLSLQSLRRQGASMRKILRYPGVKEGIYLWESLVRMEMDRKPNFLKHRRNIYIRPEPWTAQYYKGARNFMDDLITELQEHANVIILPRGSEQYEHYRQKTFAKASVLENVMSIENIVNSCDLFIGAGGTMTREMAVLGIPTISVYQDELLDVDKFLLAERAFLHMPSLNAADALAYLDLQGDKVPNAALLEKGRDAYQMIKDEVTNAYKH
jgi:predicted glycosyltransferase